VNAARRNDLLTRRIANAIQIDVQPGTHQLHIRFPSRFGGMGAIATVARAVQKFKKGRIERVAEERAKGCDLMKKAAWRREGRGAWEEQGQTAAESTALLPEPREPRDAPRVRSRFSGMSGMTDVARVAEQFEAPYSLGVSAVKAAPAAASAGGKLAATSWPSRGCNKLDGTPAMRRSWDEMERAHSITAADHGSVTQAVPTTTGRSGKYSNSSSEGAEDLGTLAKLLAKQKLAKSHLPGAVP
jgi:hypothetical protein